MFYRIPTGITQNVHIQNRNSIIGVFLIPLLQLRLVIVHLNPSPHTLAIAVIAPTLEVELWKPKANFPLYLPIGTAPTAVTKPLTPFLSLNKVGMPSNTRLLSNYTLMAARIFLTINGSPLTQNNKN